MNELTKSIKAVLYERIQSPLAGSFLLTWLVWNWKIIYVTFFISEYKIEGTRIEYIINSSDQLHLVWGPVFSTIAILTIIPLISYYAYWLSLIFKKMYIDKKNKIEGETLLTKKQNLELHRRLKEELEKVATIVLEKEEKVEQIKSEMTSMKELHNKQIANLQNEKKELKNDLELMQLDLDAYVLAAKSKSDIEKMELSQIELLKLKEVIKKSDRSDLTYRQVILKRDIDNPFSKSELTVDLLNFFINRGLVKDVGDNYAIITKKGKKIFDSLKKGKD